VAASAKKQAERAYVAERLGAPQTTFKGALTRGIELQRSMNANVNALRGVMGGQSDQSRMSPERRAYLLGLTATGRDLLMHEKSEPSRLDKENLWLMMMSRYGYRPDSQGRDNP
jgi:hypothetical protein